MRPETEPGPRGSGQVRGMARCCDHTTPLGLDRTLADAALPVPVHRWGPLWVLAAFLLLPAVAWGAIQGRVYNGTTGDFVPRVPVTLIEIGGAQGMAPVEEVYTGSDGSFAFDRQVGGTDGRAVHGMLRAEFEGVSYSQIIAPGAPTDDVRVTVYSVAEEELKPRVHGLLLEPRDGEILINEFFSFSNETQPPRTFRDADRGAVRFHLGKEAHSSLQVRTTGPAGMPLPGAVSDTGVEDVYSVDFALKPGENHIELTYRVPHADGGSFRGRVLYDGLATNLVVPPGVSLEGEGLVSLGEHPEIKTAIFQIPPTREFEISISGQGRLRRSGPEGAPDSPEIKVAAAPVAQELTWLLAITGAILAIGFFRLVGSKLPSTSPGGDPQIGRGGAAAKGKRGPAGKASRPGRRKR